MTHKTLTYHDLAISPSDIYEQMGYRDAMPDQSVVQETLAVMGEVKEWLRPEFCLLVVRELPDFNMGRIILNQLRGSEAYCLFICTSGVDYEAYQQRLKKEGDMVKTFIADAMGSVIAEKCADFFEQYLQGEIDKLGWKHTNRFSPGYCGWHVSEQQRLFPFFKGETCGVKLTDSSLMVPIKSVSGITGLGKKVRRLDYTCGLCDFKLCYKRKQKAR